MKQYIEDKEVPKYRKKSKKKNVKRSNHKHQYKRSLLHILDSDSYYLCDYCEICGKIKDFFWDYEKDEDGRLYTVFTDEQLLNRYRDIYEIKEINTYKDKYVSI